MARPKGSKSVKKVEGDIFTATVKIMGKVYTASGSTISDAIGGLDPINCKGKAILTVEHNGMKKERILMPVIAYRLFNTMGITHDVALKNASSLFNGI